MKLTPKQLATQEAMLLRLYPGKSLEEVYNIESGFDNCILFSNKKAIKDHNTGKSIIIDQEPNFYKKYQAVYFRDYLHTKVLGLPPTLPRVLDALRSHSIRRCNFLGEKYNYVYIREVTIEESIERKLRNDDGTDATLRDQSQETQDAVSSLLGVD